MRKLAIALLLAAACAKESSAPPPSRPPVEPAPGVRTDRSAYTFINGPQGPELRIIATLRAPAHRSVRIDNCNGVSPKGLQRRIGETWIDAWAAALNACASAPIVLTPNGEYTELIFVHARSGGVIDPRGAELIEPGTYRVVWFGADGPLEERVSAPFTIEVPEFAQPLTQEEAERLVRQLADAINDPQRDPTALAAHVLHGPEALRVALVQYRHVLGKVTNVRHVERFTFELQGEKKTSRVDVHKERGTLMHSPLIDYGFRGERFMKAYLGAIAAGDAERLSRVLNPDDVDFPVERARERIAAYRKRYRDVAAIRAEFVNVDERKNVLHWRLRGTGPGGAAVKETIDLGFGDGLIGIRGL